MNGVLLRFIRWRNQKNQPHPEHEAARVLRDELHRRRLAEQLQRMREEESRPRPGRPGGAGVREPRRPIPNAPAGSSAVEPPEG